MPRLFTIFVIVGLLSPALCDLSGEEKMTPKMRAGQIYDKLFVSKDMDLKPEEIYTMAKEMMALDTSSSSYDSKRLVVMYEMSDSPCNNRTVYNYDEIMNAISYSRTLDERFAEYKAFCLMRHYKNCESVIEVKVKDKIESLEDDKLDHMEFLDKAYLQPSDKCGNLCRRGLSLSKEHFGKGMLTFLLEAGFLRNDLQQITRPEKMRVFLRERMKEVQDRCTSIIQGLKPWSEYFQKLYLNNIVIESEFSTLSKWLPRINLCASIPNLCWFNGQELNYRECLRPAVEDFKKFVKHD